MGSCIIYVFKLKRKKETNIIKEDRTGEIGYNKFGTPMKIIKYHNTSNLTIEFQDVHKYKMNTTIQNFNRGQVKNPYDRIVFGIGYLGEGEYKTIGKHKGDRFVDNVYTIWRNMIERCYSEEFRSKHLTYIDCYVSDEWHCFQNFASWYYPNHYQVGTERMHLDKDILYKNNKFYSPETCLIVPQRINMMFIHPINKSDLPTGISRCKYGYVALYNTKHLGEFKTIDEAMYEYNKEKQIHIRNVADEYKAIVPNKLYQALYNWIPDESKIIQKESINVA